MLLQSNQNILLKKAKLLFNTLLVCGYGHSVIQLVPTVYNREESVERRHTVHKMYAESNVTSCIYHGLEICTLTNPSVGDVILS